MQSLLNIAKNLDEKIYVIQFSEKMLAEDESQRIYMYNLVENGPDFCWWDTEQHEFFKKRAFDRFNEQHTFWRHQKHEAEVEEVEKEVKRIKLT